MRILAIPVHEDAKTKLFQSEALAARSFHTEERIIRNLVESGEALVIDAKHSWCFDEPIEGSGSYKFKCIETGEEITLYSPKEFCDWSGYKTTDAILKCTNRITNRNDGKVYEMVD